MQRQVALQEHQVRVECVGFAAAASAFPARAAPRALQQAMIAMVAAIRTRDGALRDVDRADEGCWHALFDEAELNVICLCDACCASYGHGHYDWSQ